MGNLSAVIIAVKDGVFSAWNRDNPALALRAHDRIVEVNGIRDGAAKILEQIKRETQWALVIQRPVESSITIMNSSLGLALKYSPCGNSLMVNSVDEGPIHEWNEGKKGRQVKRFDRIVEVNGVRGLPLGLVEAAQLTAAGNSLDLIMTHYDYSM